LAAAVATPPRFRTGRQPLKKRPESAKLLLLRCMLAIPASARRLPRRTIMTQKYLTDDLRIAEIKEVANPLTVCEEFPLTEHAARVTWEARRDIQNIMDHKDDRLVVIAGPCSIHDPDAAMEYASRLAAERRHYADTLMIVMRTYFEKPRTTVGWKGLI